MSIFKSIVTAACISVSASSLASDALTCSTTESVDRGYTVTFKVLENGEATSASIYEVSLHGQDHIADLECWAEITAPTVQIAACDDGIVDGGFSASLIQGGFTGIPSGTLVEKNFAGSTSYSLSCQ